MQNRLLKNSGTVLLLRKRSSRSKALGRTESVLFWRNRALREHAAHYRPRSNAHQNDIYKPYLSLVCRVSAFIDSELIPYAPHRTYQFDLCAFVDLFAQVINININHIGHGAR